MAIYKVFNTIHGFYVMETFSNAVYALNYINTNYDVDDREYCEIHKFTITEKFKYNYLTDR